MKTVTFEAGDLLSALVAVNALLLKRTRLECIRVHGADVSA